MAAAPQDAGPAADRGAFIWYELATADAAAASAFYGAVVGWSVGAPITPPGGPMDYRMIVRADGGFAGGLAVLSPAVVAGGARPGWLAYVHVPDVDASAAAMAAAGGAVVLAPFDLPGVGRMALIADPWGARLYVMTPVPPPGDPQARSDVFSPDRPQHVRWNELESGDAAAAARLYGALFGWTQDGSMPMGAMGDYLFLQHRGTAIGAVFPAVPGGAGPRWNQYFGVPDIDRAAAAVAAGGGRVTDGPHPIPGGEFSLRALDPEGIAFGLVGPRTGASA